jgi:hypothetical protein
MRKRSSKKPPETNKITEAVAEPAVAAPVPDQQQPPHVKNAAAVALGRLGGVKGGKARAAKLSPKRRKEIAKKAARARWGKKKS